MHVKVSWDGIQMLDIFVLPCCVHNIRRPTFIGNNFIITIIIIIIIIDILKTINTLG